MFTISLPDKRQLGDREDRGEDRGEDRSEDQHADEPDIAEYASIAAASTTAMRSALLAAALAGLALSTPVRAASFDCSKARSFSEKTVCATPRLSALDDTLGAAYTKAYAASLHKPAIAATRVQEWHWRQSHCRNATCVEDWYTRRIAEVEADYAQSMHRGDDSGNHANRDTRIQANGAATDSSNIEASNLSSAGATDKAGSRHNPPLPPDAATDSEIAATDASADSTGTIAWSLPTPSASWNYPPLPPMSSHTPLDTRKIRPLDTTASVSSRTIGIFVGF